MKIDVFILISSANLTSTCLDILCPRIMHLVHSNIPGSMFTFLSRYGVVSFVGLGYTDSFGQVINMRPPVLFQILITRSIPAVAYISANNSRVVPQCS